MMSEKEKYVAYIIENNPLKQIFPITHKSNHGIDLKIWFKACLKIGLNVILCDYLHHFGPDDNRISKQIRLANN